MIELTILTPTFQRRENLAKLYESLQYQKCKDFEWLIIDDGSTDGTENDVKKWIKEADFPILYYYKENGGKQTVINYAMSIIQSRMTFIVDSDDWLTEDAVQVIYDYDGRYCSQEDLCGYSFWRVFPDGKPNGPVFPIDDWICSYFEARVLKHNGGDKAEVWITKCLKEYPFPEFEGEKYYPEDGIWIRLSGPYKMVHVNKGIYIGDYLEGGITDSNISKRMRKWPKGMVDRAVGYLEKPCGITTLIKQTLLYIIYGNYGAKYEMTKLYADCPRKVLFVLCWLPGMILGKWYEMKAH